MNTIKMNIADLKHPEKNVRRHPQKQIDEMIRSIEMFGQYRPVVVDETNTILAGNGLVIALREMGKETADVLQYTDLTPTQKKKLMIADNQVTSLGVDDYGVIEELLKSLDGDFDVPGYSEDDIKLLVEEADAVIDSVASYGSFVQDNVDQLKKEEYNREENGFKPVAQTYQDPVHHQPNNEMPKESSPQRFGEEQHEITQSQRYVICPHCGEKIFI